MRPRNMVGALFLSLMAFVVVGPALGALPYQGPPENASISVASAALGIAWISALWGALVTLMVFLIVWLAESWVEVSTPAEEGDRAPASELSEVAMQPRPGFLAKAS